VGGLFLDFEAVRTASRDRDAPRRPVREGTLKNCIVHFLDGSQLTVGVARHDRCSDVIGAVASRLGIGPRASGALALYAGRGDASRGRSRLERRVPPHAAMLPLCDEQRVALILAVRLFTAPLHDAALRALRGSQTASREDQAVGRLVLAQTTAQVMRRGYARLPRLVARSPSRASSSSSFALSPLSHLSDSESDSDDDDVDVWGSVAASGKLAAPTRLRLGALRLWSRARDVTSRSGGDEVEACRTLVREQGLAPFCPVPLPSPTELLEEVTQLLRRRDQLASFAPDESDDATADVDLEIEGADSLLRHDTPEASYVELLARSPFHGATLFGGVDDARLAISRRGCAVLTGDGAARELDIPLESARRWRVVNHALHLDRETPVQKWPLQCSRIARDPAAPQPTSWYSPPPTPTLKSPKPPPITKHVCGVDSTQGAPGGAAEACALLDDYALCDLAESPPAFGWESPDAQGRTAADRKNDRRQAELQGESREEALRREKPAQAPLLGGFYDALVAAVVRPPRFEYDPRLLGPSSFSFGGRRYHRHDVVIENDRGLRLHGSHWRSCDDERCPCVVFGHANSASRAQACHYLSLVLGLGCSLFAFDCADSASSLNFNVTWSRRCRLHDHTRVYASPCRDAVVRRRCRERTVGRGLRHARI
jgi:hypothetical protein